MGMIRIMVTVIFMVRAIHTVIFEYISVICMVICMVRIVGIIMSIITCLLCMWLLL